MDAIQAINGPEYWTLISITTDISFSYIQVGGNDVTPDDQILSIF